ncbi:MAG: acyltransferase family protein [Solirubrobacteraceae bacterium]
MGATEAHSRHRRGGRQFALGSSRRRAVCSGTTKRKSGGEHRGFRPDVEGLRAVAILLVVLYHAHVGISGGYVGVDVFFVISGFLITGQLVRELRTRGQVSFLGFYARRARRILPAATLTTVVTVLVSAVVLDPLTARRVLGDGLAAVFFGANYHFAAQGADYFNAGMSPSPMQHYWSLSVEEQFYIVWPLLLVFSSLVWVRARRARALASRRPQLRVVIAVLGALALVSLLASILQTPQTPSWAYYSIMTRAWELATGALIALALPFTERLDRRVAVVLTWAGLASIVLASTSFTDRTPYPSDAALLPVLGAAAIIAGGSTASNRWGAEALLGTQPFQRMGSWSYSWYLWHWPALILAAAVLGHALSGPEAIGVAAISLLVAIASFVLVERPIRRIQVIVRRPALGIACGGALAATAVAAVALSGTLVGPLSTSSAAAAPRLTQSHAPPARQLMVDLATGVKTRTVPSNLDPPLDKAAKSLPLIVSNGCHLQHAETKSKPCVYGDTNSRTLVVLFGDSHAATWFPALDLIGKHQHWRLVDFTKAGCPPALVNIIFTSGSTPYPQCTEWRRNAMAQISSLHPALVIVSWARYVEEPEARALPGVPTGYGSVWLNGLAASFSFLRRSAKHVIFVSDTPTLKTWAPSCVAGHLSHVQSCTTKRSTATLLASVKRQELALARSEGIDTIDPTSWFCDPTTCPVIVGNILLYRDNAHMVPAWSRFIAPVLADSIVPTVNPGLGGAATRSGRESLATS